MLARVQNTRAQVATGFGIEQHFDHAFKLAFYGNSGSRSTACCVFGPPTQLALRLWARRSSRLRHRKQSEWVT